MNFQHYLECMWKRKDVYGEMNLIRNYKHKIFSETVSKKAITAFDNKRYIMSDGINTLPYGFKVYVLIQKGLGVLTGHRCSIFN